MLARRLPTILPPLGFDEALETTRVWSAGGLHSDGLVVERPFRSPHHSVTVAGLVGDQFLRPGEVSLAHHGVLFLDEAPEFSRTALEVLRQPLEDGVVSLSRARGTVEYPAAITLVMACNPCPCGLRGSGACRCTDGDVHRYLRRLSGPIMDRIDLHLELQAVPSRVLVESGPGERSSDVRGRVLAARARQSRRGQTTPNGRLPPDALERHARLTPDARELLVRGAERHGLSGRAIRRVTRVALTLADLDADDAVQADHVAGALAFRPPAALA